MEDKVANIIALCTIICLLVLIVVARLVLKLSKPFFLICGVAVTVIFAICLYLLIFRRYSRRRKQLESQLVSEGRELRIEYSFLRKVAGVPTKYQHKELAEATDNFRVLLGRGASASVFKGVLADGTTVAVKRIEGEKHGDREFRAEVAAIASVQHVNLVRLLGYSLNSSDGQRFLVYEFIPNGSLDCWIFPRGCRGCLSWVLRCRVALDVAKALAYLHHDCRSRVLHLDVKPENILLDENYRAIVSDFGLSKLMSKDESRVITTVRGTRGYLAPEWLLQCGVSEKSDIYSYGMVLLELIGGQRNVSWIEGGNKNDRSQRRWQYFPKIVAEKKREGKLMEIVDERLVESGGVDEKEVRRLVHVALWCIQERARLRPSMATVVEMLEGRVTVDEPPETQMVLVDILNIGEDNDDHQRESKVAVVARQQEDVTVDVPSTSTCSFAMSVLSPR